MAATLTINHPVISQLPQTFISFPTLPGDSSIVVKNSASFAINQYILVGQYGYGQAQILLISGNNPNSTTIQASPTFGFPIDTPIQFIPFNQIKVYRSLTGVGGTYTFLASIPIEVEQKFSSYTDNTAVSPYSYRYTFFNSTLNIETDFSSENPYAGFPFTSLQNIQDRVLSLFVDTQGEYVTLTDIANWTNELISHLNREVTDSDSQLFANFATFTPGTSEYTDISQYAFESITLVEYTSDGGLTYNSINPMDSRFGRILNPTSQYSWNLIGDKLFIVGGFPANLAIRVWGYTQQPILVQSSDILPVVYRSYSDVFVDYCMMRGNEKARRVSESAAYYGKKFNIGFNEIIDSVRSRIGQGNESMAITWLNNF